MGPIKAISLRDGRGTGSDQKPLKGKPMSNKQMLDKVIANRQNLIESLDSLQDNSLIDEATKAKIADVAKKLRTFQEEDIKRRGKL